MRMGLRLVCYNGVMRILEKEITKNELFDGSGVVFGGEMVKGVVDIKRELVAVDAELHADLERLLLENGSEQENLWGVNFWNSDEDTGKGWGKPCGKPSHYGQFRLRGRCGHLLTADPVF